MATYYTINRAEGSKGGEGAAEGGAAAAAAGGEVKTPGGLSVKTAGGDKSTPGGPKTPRLGLTLVDVRTQLEQLQDTFIS